MVVVEGFNGIFGSGLAFILFLGFVAIVLAILIFVFWISMLIDCIKRKYKEAYDKIVWVLVIIFTGIIGALIYYFVVKVKNKKR